MNKLIAGIISLAMGIALTMPLVECRRGGGAVIGGFAGGMMGSMVGSAIARDSGSSRAAEEAREARQETRDLRRDQERERIARIEQQRRDDELRRLQDKLKEAAGTNVLTYFLVGLVLIFAVALVGLGFLLVKRKG